MTAAADVIRATVHHRVDNQVARSVTWRITATADRTAAEPFCPPSRVAARPSMKGPLESRHTSSERARATSREHARLIEPTGRAQRAIVVRATRTSVHQFVGVPFTLLRAPDVCDASIRARPRGVLKLRLAHVRRHSVVDASSLGWHHGCSSAHPHVERTSCADGVATRDRRRRRGRARAPRGLSSRLSAARAVGPIGPRVSWRLIACIAASTRAQRIQGDPPRDAAVVVPVARCCPRAGPGRRSTPARPPPKPGRCRRSPPAGSPRGRAQSRSSRSRLRQWDRMAARCLSSASAACASVCTSRNNRSRRRSVRRRLGPS